MFSSVDLSMAIASSIDADSKLERMRLAQEKFYSYSQQQVDSIFEKVSDNIKSHSVELAKMAVEESKIGCVEDKILKNIYASEHSYAMYKDTKTVGITDHNIPLGISKIAEPVGPICAILPCTNPTSTVIFKSLYSLKTRNCVVFLPHPRTKNCSIYAADLIHKYAIEAGAPQDVIMSCLPSREISDYIMRHKETKFLLATGGSDMVKSCYSIGKPAIGVGPGNTPVVIDDTFDLREAVNSILIGKTFDWGVPCITEQSIIILESVYEKVKEILEMRGVYFLGDYEKKRVSDVFMPGGVRVNPEIVGKSPQFIADTAGIEIPPLTLALGAEVSEVGEHEVFSHEKMSPIIALYRTDTFEKAVEIARELVLFGGPGHSSCLYTNDEKRIEWFQNRIPTYHVNINMPALGGIGIRYNPNVAPSMTVGCGVHGGSMASVNVGPNELIQIKTVARKISSPHPFVRPHIIRGTIVGSLGSLKLVNENIVIITDPNVPNKSEMFNLLRTSGHNLMIFNDLTADVVDIENKIPLLHDFKPTIFFAIGKKETIDTSKLVRLRYENRDVSLEKIVAPFIGYERHDQILGLKNNIRLVVVPTMPSSVDMTPFTQNIIQNNKLNLTVYTQSLRPSVVVYDYDTIQEKETVWTNAYVILLQGIEAFVSADSNEETRQMILDATRQIFSQLSNSETDNHRILDACAQMSIAISHNGVGLGTSMAAKMSSFFGIPFPSALSSVMPYVIEYNSSICPKRGAVFPFYPYPMANIQYSLLATSLGMTGNNEEKRQELIKALRAMRYNMGLEKIHSLINRDAFINHLCELSEMTFGDPLQSTNPRMVFIPDIKKIYKNAYFD
jgi:acetaldehyde dehydrogenase/alcohol dehydrogenase